MDEDKGSYPIVNFTVGMDLKRSEELRYKQIRRWRRLIDRSGNCPVRFDENGDPIPSRQSPYHKK